MRAAGAAEVRSGSGRYHRALHPIQPTRSISPRAAHAPQVFAFVLSLWLLVLPVGPLEGPILAAGRPILASAELVAQNQASPESSLVALVNVDRAAVGLRPLLVDSRLAAIAGQRSAAMAAAGHLSHVQPDGRTAVDMIAAAGITWYGAGESIGWNTYRGLSDSMRVVNDGWLSSPEHAAIIRSTDYNYIGVGLGVTAGGDRYWTAIFLRGPDRTAPWAKMLAPEPGASILLASGRGTRRVIWSWTGDDRQLAVLTSGLRSFEVQRRIDGGAWVSLWTSTDRRSWSSSVPAGHRVQMRVRARDNAGNVGTWTSPVGVSA
jgi:uncharacterized protein YkwD